MPNSRNKGVVFERDVAQELRKALDPPEVTEAIASAAPSRRPQALMASRVRRGRQGEGARECDIVVEGTLLWIECQHASREKHDPAAKLAQAERDAAEVGAARAIPIAVTHCTGERRRGTTATMRLGTLLRLLRARCARPAPAAARVELRLEDLLTLLRDAPIES